MALLPIIKLDDPVLRKKAVRVTSFGPDFQRLVDDMVETMIAAPGVGLAAPQVNVSQRLIVVRLSDDEDSRKEFGDLAGKLFVVVNPKIIKTSRTQVDGVEACLSIPGYAGTVFRHEQVVITGEDRHGKPIRIKAKDWLARVFQHEIDHLDGRLFIDIAEEIWDTRSKPADGEAAKEDGAEAGERQAS
ncbi:MAG: peptide deformylase [Chloroflexi bacterium]|jgi:peptide deformylase|nr:peptide deformylase [Chloroflexota bacterium]MBV6435078.1 Peptide deformylase 2 [Anaerolineae bacterium]MDL1914467.1 peptide deformylase [Anaerolineae bacterium CFX4]OQY76433.1 MAG: peptide deformylase [Anaerolineae bacterium UTCFX5]MBW7879879.1 peptide deformylase [Anaerolineae bacterium]